MLSLWYTVESVHEGRREHCLRQFVNTISCLAETLHATSQERLVHGICSPSAGRGNNTHLVRVEHVHEADDPLNLALGEVDCLFEGHVGSSPIGVARRVSTEPSRGLQVPAEELYTRRG